MAQAFLNQLLTTENCVQSENNAQCSVCLKTYGTLTDTAAIECEIRLPCNHTLGSVCAFTWLSSHKTCPLCRQELYSDQPTACDGTLLDIIPRAASADRDDHTMSYMIEYYCENSILDDELVRNAMAEILRPLVQGNGFDLESIVGAAVYITLNLLGHPRSSLEISRELGVEEDVIRLIYTLVYANREILITNAMLGALRRGHIEDVVAFLPPPESYEEVVGDENEGLVMPRTMLSGLPATDARSLRVECAQVCWGQDRGVVFLVQQIAEKIREQSYLDIRGYNRIIAVSIFLAGTPDEL